MSTTRRGRGEGTIGQLGDGRWWARVDLGYRDGKRVRKAVYGATRAAVAALLTKNLRDVHDSAPIPTRDQTVRAFLVSWLETVAKPNVRPTTFRSYEQIARLHLMPGVGHYRLSKLTPQHVHTWMSEHVEAGASAQLVTYSRNVLRVALAQALRWGLVGRNVATLVRPPRASRRQIAPLTPEQAQTFLTATHDHRLAALFSVGLALGLRQGEALALTWGDVDLDSAALRVQATLQRVGRTWVRAEPKSTKGRRTVSLPGICVAALRKHRARQLEDRLKAGPCWQENGLVFASHTGTPLHPRNVLRDFQRLLKQAGLPIVRFHDLRHSCATILLVQGINARVVMEILGHSQISLTLNTYSHVMPALQADAAAKMHTALGGQPR